MSTADHATKPRAHDELEELAEADFEELEPTLQMPIRAGVGAGRSSAPPPVPLVARRSSVPPTPSQSGMFRIGDAPASGTGGGEDTSTALARVQALHTELHERATQIDRLRLAVTMRDDRLRELERALRWQRQRADDLERSVSEQRAQIAALERARLERASAPLACGDDLRRIRGVGPVFARKLAELGLTRFEQLAALGEAQIVELAATLGVSPRRIEREGWVARAAELAAERARADT